MRGFIRNVRDEPGIYACVGVAWLVALGLVAWFGIGIGSAIIDEINNPSPPARVTETYTAPGGNCDDIGHSYSVPDGAYDRHDRDGDGIACEQ
ncbi:hypothetical protein [Patulibacter sp.]|uniref:hypothetical protein n=1 Tax=Patulibacter sp. TaxID=1912859 RepID=UPI00271AECA3|nr:hypothetical protein [Patulibacter sp.]MDO9409713.1 hypothetical protein [Patulibacter sp.]